jgi:hypothetical protein
VSGGALTALAFALGQSAALDPRRFGGVADALEHLASFLRRARSRDLRSLNPNPLYGLFNLGPLRRYMERWLVARLGRKDLALSELPLRLYLCAADRDATFTLFGAPDDALQFEYGFVRVGPPRDAPMLDALIAALSTSLSTGPEVHGEGIAIAARRSPTRHRHRSGVRRAATYPVPRPVHAAADPEAELISSFIMHRHHEQNQRCWPATIAIRWRVIGRRREASRGAARLAARSSTTWTCPTSAAPKPSPTCVNRWPRRRR